MSQKDILLTLALQDRDRKNANNETNFLSKYLDRGNKLFN